MTRSGRDGRSEARGDASNAFRHRENELHHRKDWTQLAKLYEKRLLFESDAKERASIRLRLAQLFHSKLHRLDRAQDQYRALLEEPSTCEEARAGLKDLFREDERWTDLADLLATEVEEAGVRRAVPAARELVSLYGDHLNELDRAIAIGFDLLAVGGTEASDAELLEKLCLKSSDATAVARLRDLMSRGPAGNTRTTPSGSPLESGVRSKVESDLVAEERWPDLEAFLTERIRTEDIPARRAELLVRRARCRREQGENADGARSDVRQALQLDPQVPDALELLETCGASREDYSTLQRSYRELLEVYARSPERQFDLSRKLGLLLIDRLDQAEVGLERLRNAIESSDDQNTAWLRVSAGMQERGLWSSLATLAIAGLAQEWIPHARRSSLEEVARKAAAQGDQRAALDLLEALSEWGEGTESATSIEDDILMARLAAEPTDESARERLRGLCQSRDDWSPWLEMLQRAASEAAPRQAAALLRERAEILTEQGDEEAAASDYRVALENDPTDSATGSWLRRHDAQGGDWSGVLTTLRIQLAAGPSDPEPLYEELARVAEQEIGDPIIAEEAWMRLTELRPGDRSTWDRWRRSAERAERWDHVAEAFVGLAERQPDPSDPAALDEWRAAAEAFVRHEDRAGAEQCLRRILEHAPTDTEAHEGLAELLEHDERFEDLVAHLEHGVQCLANGEHRTKTVRRLAQALTTLQRADEALAMWQLALKSDPSDSEALEKIGELAEQLGDPSASLLVLEARLSEVEEDSTRAELLRRKGELLLGPLNRAEDGIACLTDAAPHDSRALKQLARLQAERRDWPRVLELYEVELARADDEITRAAIHQKMAILWESELLDNQRAIEHLEKAWSEREGDIEILEGLERLYRASGDWERAADVVSRRLEREEDPRRSPAAALELAQIHRDHLGDPEAALQLLEAARNRWPDQLTILRELRRGYRQAVRWKECAQTLERELEATRDPVARRELLGERAQLFEGPLRDPAAAASTYQNILADLPQDRFALRGLVRVARRIEDWKRLSAGLTHLAQLEEDPERSARYARELGELFSRNRDQRELAEHWFRKCLQTEPADPIAMTSLSAILREGQRWEELVTLLAENEPKEASPLRTTWRLARARALERLKRGNEAGRVYESILESEPDRANIRDRAIELANRHDRIVDARRLLEEGLAGEPAESVGARWKARLSVLLLESGDLELANGLLREAAAGTVLAADLLERHAFAQIEASRWAAAAEVRELQLARAFRPAERHSILLSLGEIYSDRLDLPEEALRCFEEARALDPVDRHGLDLLAHLYERCERWTELATLDQRRTALSHSRAEEVDVIVSRARLLEERLGDAAAAISAYERALDLDPSSNLILTALARLYREHARRIDLVRVLEHWLQSDDPACDRFTVYRELARLWSEDLDRPSHAIECLRCARDLNPDSRETLQDLADLLGRAGRSTEQLGVLLAALERFPESERGEIRQRIEELLLNPLRPGGERARDMLERLLAQWPDCLVGRRKLAASCLRDELDDRAETVLEGLVRDDDGESRRAGHALLLARLLQDRLHRPHDAIPWLERAADLGSRRATSSLELAYRRWGYWPELTQRQEARLSDLEPEERVALGREIASVHERYLSSPIEAARVLRRVLDEDLPADQRQELVGDLERLYAQVGCSEELADLQRLQSDAETVDVERLLRSAEELSSSLNDVDRAAHCLNRVLELEPGRTAALDALIDLLRRARRWEELAATLERRIEQIDDPKEAAGVRAELGLVLFGPLSRRDEAWELLQQAVADGAQTVDVLDASIALATDREEWEPVAEMLRLRIAKTSAGPDRARWIARRARLLADELDRRDEALKALREAWKHDPACAEARTLLQRLTDETDRLAVGPKNGAVEETQVAARPESSEQPSEGSDSKSTPRDRARELEDVRHELCERRSELVASDLVRLLARRAKLEEETGHPETALLTWLELLEHHPEHIDGLETVAGLYRRGAHSADALPYLDRLVGQLARRPSEVERLLSAQRCRAELFEQEGDWQAAARAYREALEKEPDAADLLESLASLYVRNGRWIDAEHHLSRLLSVAQGDEQLRTTRFLLGQVLLKGLDRPEDAEVYFREVRDDPRLGTSARLGLATALEARERWDEALEVLAELVESSTTPRQRTTVRLRRARLLRDRCHRPKQAYEVLLEAAGENPSSEALLEEATKTLRGMGDEEGLANLWRSYLDHLSPAKRRLRLDLSLELARLYAERLSRPDEAAEIYRQALADSEEDARVTLEFAAVLSRTDAGSREAVRLFRNLLHDDPTRSECLNALETLLQGQGDQEGVLMVQGCRDVLGLLTPRERTRYRASLRPWSAAPFARTGRFPASLHPKPDAAIGAAAILLQLVPTLGELFPPEAIPKRVVRECDNSPLLKRLDEIAQAFRLGSVQLHVLSEEPRSVRLLCDEPWIFGASERLVLGTASAETIFHAARALAGPLGGFGPLLRIGPDRAADALRALAHIDRKASVGGRRSDRVTALSQRLRRILPTGVRRSLAALSSTVDEVRVAAQVRAFYARLDEAATRYALWLCGDPSAGLGAVADVLELPSDGGTDAWQESAAGTAALRFVLSNLYLSLRRQAGVALPRLVRDGKSTELISTGGA